MLVEFKVHHYKLFEQIDFTMEANAHIRKLSGNYTIINNSKILKSSAIFGPNNTGKSSFVNALKLMVETVQNGSVKTNTNQIKNFLNHPDENNNIEFEVVYLRDESLYNYKFEINIKNKYFEKEYLAVNDNLIFSRENGEIKVNPKYTDLKEYSTFFSNNQQLFLKQVASTESKKFERIIEAMKFFDSFIFLDASELDRGDAFEKTFHLLESGRSEFINKVMTKADVSIDNLSFNQDQFDMINYIDQQENYSTNQKKYLSIQVTHAKDDYAIKVPLILVESLGTKKLLALAGYLHEVLSQEKILVIDEIDSSFHAGLTRQLFSLFHIDEKSKAQLIATTHDLLLLETKFLFRKDQIWFTSKEQNQGYLYSLDDFKANGDLNLRKNSDVLRMYLNGMFGAMMYPDLCEAVEEIIYGEK